MDRQAVLRELVDIVGDGRVLHQPEELLVYEQDAYVMRATPDFVVLPETTSEVQRIVRLARRHGVPLVPRGAGTCVSGGAVAATGGIMLSFARMARILEVDPVNECAVVEPGVVNLDISRAAAPYGLFYAPDPSSQMVCTIGGNVAENSGGIHGVAYGVTTNHVLGLEVVLADGEVVELGGKCHDTLGYDLVGLVVGSEGTLAVVTKVVVRLMRRPEQVATMVAVFRTLEDASRTVSDIVARGLTPSALELMDRMAVRAVEEVQDCGYPTDAGAVLLIELEGVRESIERPYETIREIALANGATMVRTAADEAEREQLWKGRKGVFAAVSTIAPNQFTQDGVVPRPRLAEVLRRVVEIGEKHSLPIANVAHAGDGNLHPLIMFDPRKEGELERVMAAGAEILRLCVEAGGTITGEHGVGIEKNDYLEWLYGERELRAMREVKRVFDPEGLLNPGKVFPGGVAEGEWRVESIGASASGRRRGMWV